MESMWYIPWQIELILYLFWVLLSFDSFLLFPSIPSNWILCRSLNGGVKFAFSWWSQRDETLIKIHGVRTWSYIVCHLFIPDVSHYSHAKQLIEDTIRRNASPVRLEQPDKERMGGSSSSLNSSASDESNRFPGEFWFIVFGFN
jgi:hypothetical protein